MNQPTRLEIKRCFFCNEDAPPFTYHIPDSDYDTPYISICRDCNQEVKESGGMTRKVFDNLTRKKFYKR
ncbi:hypothetical protein SC499_22465 [Peribacillus simplex]|uniref:hypothetical protein n=1 Tax=Peribacillus simplex TaxID=1478 RepID=UPI00298D8F23|nr:hypothetical protein [Peribacillus simplex]MDW7617368.1 hypothetical protein [Peribacillus simplex]